MVEYVGDKLIEEALISVKREQSFGEEITNSISHDLGLLAAFNAGCVVGYEYFFLHP